MPAGLPEHDHCRYCGDAVPFEQAYCSEKCYYADQARMRKEKLRNAAFAALAIGVSALILVIGYVFRPNRLSRQARYAVA